MRDRQEGRYAEFDELVRRHKEVIVSLCRWRSGGDRTRCDELMQEVLTSLWSYRHTLREGSTPRQERAWVIWQCRGALSHSFRRRRPQIVPLDEWRAEGGEQYADSGSREERMETIEALALGLTPHERQALDLILEGYEGADLGKRLGIKAHSAAQLRLRIIEKMKRNIDRI